MSHSNASSKKKLFKKIANDDLKDIQD